MHLLLEVAGAIIGVIPLTALALAYRRSGGVRLGLAFLAFVVLEVRFITMIAIHTVGVVDHPTEELLDFGGDLAVMAAFATAFLYGTRWLPDRSAPKPT
jgi:hypothetical protein